MPELELGLRLPEGGQEQVAEVAVTEAHLPSRFVNALDPGLQAPAQHLTLTSVTSTALGRMRCSWYIRELLISG
jgi:hypothetical protein